MVNAERLSHFVQIIECGSLSAAARKVHLSQPALSRNLKLLEEELGVCLFRREGRGLQLTAAGRALQSRAVSVLDALASAAQNVRRAAERDYFDVHLGAVDSVATYLLPPVLARLQCDFPELVVKLMVARSSLLLERIAQGTLDLAVVASSGAPPNVASEAVGPYALRYYGRADRFARLSRVASTKELESFPIVQIEPGAGQGGVVSRPNVSFATATNVASVKALVLAGFGVGDLPDYVWSAEERAQLVSVDVKLDPHCGIFVATARSADRPGEERIRRAFVLSMRAALRGPVRRRPMRAAPPRSRAKTGAKR